MPMSILEIINHYQKSIEKSQGDEERLLHCINKLYKLPVNVQHLQNTGVGKTVNALRKYEGEIGCAAKALVHKWKAMVVAEEELDDGPYEEEKSQKRSSDDDHDGNVTLLSNISAGKPTGDIISQEFSNNDNLKSIEIKKSSVDNHHKHSSSKHTMSSSTSSSSENHHKRQDHTIKSSSSHKDCSSPKNSIEKQNNVLDKELIQPKHNSIATLNGKEKKDNKHKSVSSESKHNHTSSSKDKEKKSAKSEKSSSSDINEKHKSKSVSTNSRSTENSSKKSKSSTSGREDLKKIKLECDNFTNNGDIFFPEKQLSDKKSEKNSKHERRDDSDKKKLNKSKETSSSKSKSHSSSSKSHRKRDRSDAEDESPKRKISKVPEKGIDGSMGASFADVLGMCNMPSSSKNFKSSSKANSKTATSHKSSIKSYDSDNSMADLLSPSCKLEPLDSSIVLDLPAITTNYKPTPLNQTVMNCVFPPKATSKAGRALTDYEALDRVMSSKTMRTKIYSGSKAGVVTQVSTLFDMCVRILQKNIDALEYTGGVPFDILQPVLQLATPAQLYTVEEFNPYLLEDTELLWEHHVNRHYRSKKRSQSESWRDMFVRCQDEQERKLSLLAENIKISQRQSTAPMRKTQLAYMDSAVKPPRGIIRKQEIYGTKSKVVATPASRVAALSNILPNVVKLGDSRSRIRDPIPVVPTLSIRPRKAPLMAKALQQFNKGRFQR